MAAGRTERVKRVLREHLWGDAGVIRTGRLGLIKGRRVMHGRRRLGRDEDVYVDLDGRGVAEEREELLDVLLEMSGVIIA